MATLTQISTKSLPYMEHIVDQKIFKGDLLIVHYRTATIVATVDAVKSTENDGIEVIFDEKQNHYFSLSGYRKNESFVVDLYRINLK